jgi:predicted aspartyl protease
MTTVNYTNSVPYNGNRPYADVVVVGGGNPTYKALVDTGADYLQLPIAAMTSAGISASAGSPVSIRTAAGTMTTMTLVKGVKVKIETVTVPVDIVFNPYGGSGAYLGRQALLAAFEAGFKVKEWLWL